MEKRLNISRSKPIVAINIIFGLFIIFLVLFSLIGKIEEFSLKEMEKDCKLLETQINDLLLVEYEYKTRIYTDNDDIIICFDIYNYKNYMKEDFNCIFNTIYKQYNCFEFKNKKVQLKSITIFDCKKALDGKLESSYGIITKEFD